MEPKEEHKKRNWEIVRVEIISDRQESPRSWVKSSTVGGATFKFAYVQYNQVSMYQDGKKVVVPASKCIIWFNELA